MFLVYDDGVVVVDAPPPFAQHIRSAIAEVTNKPITHVIYSHSHIDHIGGTSSLGGQPVILAQEETKRLLARAKDPSRPLPTVTFADRYTLKVGSQVLELSVTAAPGAAGVRVWQVETEASPLPHPLHALLTRAQDRDQESG